MFVNECNIGIQPPTIDDCNTCSKLKIEISEPKKTDPELTNIQKLNLMKSYEQNTDNSVAVVAIDLQQALPTPKLTCNAQYYKRKIWTYNFGVHNVRTGASTMYVVTGQKAVSYTHLLMISKIKNYNIKTKTFKVIIKFKLTE